MKSYFSMILNDGVSDEILNELLKKFPDVESIAVLKGFIEECLKRKPSTAEELMDCLKNRIKKEKKLTEADSVKIKEEQEKRTIKPIKRNKQKR
jgi:hypothetical protein